MGVCVGERSRDRTESKDSTSTGTPPHRTHPRPSPSQVLGGSLPTPRQLPLRNFNSCASPTLGSGSPVTHPTVPDTGRSYPSTSTPEGTERGMVQRTDLSPAGSPPGVSRGPSSLTRSLPVPCHPPHVPAGVLVLSSGGGGVWTRQGSPTRDEPRPSHTRAHTSTHPYLHTHGLTPTFSHTVTHTKHNSSHFLIHTYGLTHLHTVHVHILHT